MKNFVKATVFAVAIVGSSAAYAFTEVPVEGATKAVPAPAPAKKGVPTLELSGGEGAASQDGKGVELSIPGIGSLGTLPKLDFGLELLYGATEQELPQDELEKIDPSEDMTIRGTLKHNF